VIKLLSRFNNQNPSSSQLNTLISSSVHGSTPSVADATQSTPPVQDVIASTPSPLVGSNASTPPDINYPHIQILEERTQLLQRIT